MKYFELTSDMREELENILPLLESTDYSNNFLGYELFKNSLFRKAIKGKLLSENKMVFFRVHCYGLRIVDKSDKMYGRITASNYDRLWFIIRIVRTVLKKKYYYAQFKEDTNHS